MRCKVSQQRKYMERVSRLRLAIFLGCRGCEMRSRYLGWVSRLRWVWGQLLLLPCDRPRVTTGRSWDRPPVPATPGKLGC